MRSFFFYLGVISLAVMVVGGSFCFWKFSPFIFAKSRSQSLTHSGGPAISLPEPALSGGISLEEALASRRSIRSFQDTPVSMEDLSQVLWSAQGVTDLEKGYRTAPSAMALYPLTVYVVAEKVDGLGQGLYRYEPGHRLVPVFDGPAKDRTMTAIRQPWIMSAPVILLISGRYDDLRGPFGDVAEFCVHAEVGHVSQNVYLQAQSLGLGTLASGGIDGDKLKAAFGLPSEESFLYAMPLGKPQEGR